MVQSYGMIFQKLDFIFCNNLKKMKFLTYFLTLEIKKYFKRIPKTNIKQMQQNWEFQIWRKMLSNLTLIN